MIFEVELQRRLSFGNRDLIGDHGPKLTLGSQREEGEKGEDRRQRETPKAEHAHSDHPME